LVAVTTISSICADTGRLSPIQSKGVRTVAMKRFDSRGVLVVMVVPPYLGF
jgi:hypothetical protein